MGSLSFCVMGLKGLFHNFAALGISGPWQPSFKLLIKISLEPKGSPRKAPSWGLKEVDP
jgi:hypothetical protein